MEHSAQVMLYTLLMSERFVCSGQFPYMSAISIISFSHIFAVSVFRYLKTIDCGLLYYLHTDQTQVNSDPHLHLFRFCSLFTVLHDFTILWRGLRLEDPTWLGWSCVAMNLQVIFSRHQHLNNCHQCYRYGCWLHWGGIILHLVAISSIPIFLCRAQACAKVAAT